jgi:hypothetical protein
MKVMPMPDDARNVTPANSALDASVTAEASPDAAPNVTPAPALNPDLPPGTVHVGLDLAPNAVAALRKAGFLAAGRASPDDIAAAVFGMLSAGRNHFGRAGTGNRLAVACLSWSRPK